jgi:hypothetical protein
VTVSQVASETHDGQLQDYVSGEWISGTPEEVPATQPFSRRLVEEFGCPTTHIQARPQFRVRVQRFLVFEQPPAVALLGATPRF